MLQCGHFSQNSHNGYLPAVWSVSGIDGLVKKRRKSSALAMELRLSCI